MTSKKEKNISKRRKRRYKRRVKTSVKLIALVLFVILILGAFVGIKIYQMKNAANPYGDVGGAEAVIDDDELLVESESAKYEVLDVEDGEAILIRFGDVEALIDTGSEKGVKKLEKGLKGKILGDLDYLIITSPNEKRTGGAKFVAENYNIGKSILAPMGDREAELKAIVGPSSGSVSEATSTSYDLGQDATLSTLLPSVSSSDLGERALITYFTFGGNGCLALSDAGKEETARALEGVGDVSLLVLARFGDLKLYNNIKEIVTTRQCVVSTNQKVSEELEAACSNLMSTKDGSLAFNVSAEAGVEFIEPAEEEPVPAEGQAGADVVEDATLAEDEE